MKPNEELQIKLHSGGYYSYIEESVVRVFRLIQVSDTTTYHAMSFAQEFDPSSPPMMSDVVALRPFIWHMPHAIANLFMLEDLKYLGSRRLTDSDVAGYRAYLTAHELPEAEIDNQIGEAIYFSKLEAVEFELRLAEEADPEDVEFVRVSPQVAEGTKITLDQGNVINLKRIYQHLTYETLVEGYPDASFNAELLTRELERARNLLGLEAHLLEPDRFKDANLAKELEEMGLWGIKPEFLPEVACWALFDSLVHDQNGSLTTSEAAFVWFQKSFAMPMHLKPLVQMREFDWAAKSKLVEFD